MYKTKKMKNHGQNLIFYLPQASLDSMHCFFNNHSRNKASLSIMPFTHHDMLLFVVPLPQIIYKRSSHSRVWKSWILTQYMCLTNSENVQPWAYNLLLNWQTSTWMNYYFYSEFYSIKDSFISFQWKWYFLIYK